MTHDYSSVTELAGEKVSKDQISRVVQRYYWAGGYCHHKDVLEVACGAGQGLGYLASVSKSIKAGDITPSLVERASSYYDNRINITVMDAENLPFAKESLDVVILFEALYYLSSAEKFIKECSRVLRPDGLVLLATANKNLYDFNLSPYSVRYYNPPELADMLLKNGFAPSFYGGSPVDPSGVRSGLFRWAKKTAVTLNLIPGSMTGKRWLKRLVFGKLLPMPQEITEGELDYQPPIPIDCDRPDITHQVLYCSAIKS